MPDAIRVRTARLEEYPACRLLLPIDEAWSSGTEYLVAVQDKAPFLLGSASFISTTRTTHCIRFRVIRTHRRRGVGSRLLAGVEASAAALGTELLLAAVDSVSEPDAGAFLGARGFQITGRATTVRAAAEPAMRTILPLADRLRSRSPDFKIVPLSEAPRNAVAALYKTQLARGAWATPWTLLDQLKSPQFADSPVLLHGDHVAGMLLLQMRGELGVIPARIVAPEFQRGPANVLLMAAAIRLGLRKGGQIVEFEIPEKNADTEKLARRLGAEVVRTRDQYLKRCAAA
jgi:GNAT superfamily N-acetyltransferase